MKRTIAVIIVLIAAAAAGFFVPQHRATRSIGYADTAALLDAATPLDSIEGSDKRVKTLRDKASQKKRPPGGQAAPLAEMERLSSAAASNKMAFVSSNLDRRARGAMRLSLEAETEKLNDWLEKKHSDVEAELDSLARETGSGEAPASQLRYRLMNLKLRLKVLTRDPISFPNTREDRIKKMIETLDRQISGLEEEIRRRHMETYEDASSRLNSEIENQYKQNRKELENELDRVLEALEAEVLGRLEEIRAETEKAAEKGGAARRDIGRLLQLAAPEPDFPFADPQTARRGYSHAKLKLKAAEICNERGIGLLLAKPVWGGEKIKDYTALLAETGEK